MCLCLHTPNVLKTREKPTTDFVFDFLRYIIIVLNIVHVSMNKIHVSQKGALMSISKYETLAKVCELGSLTKAAEALEITQSAVSHTINSLEEQFGFAILTRSRAGVKLTDNGQRIMPSVRGMLNYYEQLNQTVSAIRGLDFGTVRIGAFTSVAVHWLPGVIKEFQRDYPNVDIKLLNGDYHDVEKWLTEGSVDLGFVNLPTKLNCECIALMEDRLLDLTWDSAPRCQSG